MKPSRVHIALAVLVAVLTPPALAAADEADDQFAVAAGHYAARRWDLAAKEFEKFLADHPKHERRAKALFFSGEAIVQTGDLNGAQQQFTAVLATDPQGRYARQALFRAGECAYLIDKPDDAGRLLAEFHEKFASDALDAYALFYLGELALRSGDAESAKKHYSEVNERFPDGPTSSDCRLGLAQAHLRLEEYGPAETVLGALLKQERLIVEANYWLGQVYRSQAQWERAAEVFQAAIVADPMHAGIDTLRYQAAESLLRAEKFAAAIEIILGSDPQRDVASLPAEQGYLIALAQQGLKQHDNALATLAALSKAGSDTLAIKVLMAKATSLVSLARDRDAIETLEACLKVAGDDDVATRTCALAQLAICYARCKDFNHAKATLNHLTTAAPRLDLTRTTILQLAQIASAAKELAWAADLYMSAAEDPTAGSIATSAQMGLAQMAFEAGELEKAAALYEQILQQHTEDPQAASAAIACAEVRERLTQYDAALAMYTLVIEKHGDAEQLPQALLHAANLCDRLSQETKAIELYERLAREFKDSPLVPAAVYGWGWCLRDLKREEEANEKFEQLRHDYPASAYWADATYRLAQFVAQSKNLDRAMELLSELIDAAGKRESGEEHTPAKKPTADGEDAKTTVSDEDDGAATAPPKLDEAARKVPHETLQHALYLRAQIAITLSKWDEAARDLERLLHEQPNAQLALAAEFLRADVAYRRGDYDEAGKRFTALALKLNQRNDRWIPMVPLRRAQIYAQQKRWSDARAVAEQIAKDYPNFDQQYEADYVSGRCWAAEANLEEARRSYQRVLRSPQGAKTETAAIAQWMIGETYFLQEQYSTAIREYLRVEVLYAYPHWQAAALLQAGKCYELTGQWKDAGEAYARLLKLHAQSDFAVEARERLQKVQTRTASRNKR